MAEPSGHLLFTEALSVMNRAIEAHEDEPPCREIIERTSDRRGQRVFSVSVLEGDPERIVDRYAIRVHEGRFAVVGASQSKAAVDWQVAVDDLRRLVARPDAYVEDPSKLGLRWLELQVSSALVEPLWCSSTRGSKPAGATPDRELFDLIAAHGWTPADPCGRLRDMAGFRSILVHGYAEMNPRIVRSVVEDHLGELGCVRLGRSPADLAESGRTGAGARA